MILAIRSVFQGEILNDSDFRSACSLFSTVFNRRAGPSGALRLYNIIAPGFQRHGSRTWGTLFNTRNVTLFHEIYSLFGYVFAITGLNVLQRVYSSRETGPTAVECSRKKVSKKKNNPKKKKRIRSLSSHPPPPRENRAGSR